MHVRRAKFGESAFLEVYQKLYEAPDPSTVLINATVSPSRLGMPHGFLHKTMLYPQHCLNDMADEFTVLN